MNARRRSIWVVVLCAACGSPPPSLDLPSRSGDALGGADVAQAVRDLDLDAREERIYAEVARGNVPSWLRELRPIRIEADVDGVRRTVTFWATPDYLAVGSDTDFVLFPLTPQVAQRVADLVGGSLPTTRMVDAIWRSAERRLAPIRMEPNMLNLRVAAFEHHNRLIRAQRLLNGVEPGLLVAGHKKDVVIATTLETNPGRVAVYGWHRPEGRPIQALYTGLAEARVEFSHGIRLVHRSVMIDGTEHDLMDVLRDPELAPLLSDGGVIAEPRYSLVRTPPAPVVDDTVGVRIHP